MKKCVFLPKKLFAYILTFLITVLALTSSALAAEQQWPEMPELDGEAVVLMETNTSAVVYEKNAEEKMYPASTTKILTAIVVLEHCSMDETVTFTAECCDLEDGAVTIDSVPGEEMPLKDVMYGLLLPSGNDCAMALAIHVAGSVDAFAEMMNEKAKEIGALSSHFVNPSGLFNSNHYTTASDLALIAQYAFQNSTFVDIISHPTYIIEPTNMNSESRVLTNTHEMIIPGGADYNSDVIGGKTGYLYEAGRCLVTYAERDGINLLAVILDGDYYGIFSETQELLDYGWDNFSITNVSENERKFSYADEAAKVQLDSSSQILTLKNVDFSDLTSTINYAYYLDETEYAKAKEAAGVTANDSRQLYATIDYSYAGYYLGSCNVFVNPDLKTNEVQFINVYFINIWLVLLIVILIILAIIFLIKIAKKSSLASTRRGYTHPNRKSGTRAKRSQSDSIDLGNRYIRSSNKRRDSVYDLNEIGISYSRNPEYEEYDAGRSPRPSGGQNAVRNQSTRSSSQKAVKRQSPGRSRSASSYETHNRRNGTENLQRTRKNSAASQSRQNASASKKHRRRENENYNEKYSKSYDFTRDKYR